MDELEELFESAQLSIRDAGKVPRVANLREFSALMKTPAFERIEDYSIKTFNAFIKDNDINVARPIIDEFDNED